MILNMCKINGNIYIHESFYIINDIEFNKEDEFYTYHKTKNMLFRIPDNGIDFIIMGTQKGGTTIIPWFISYHPHIFINGDNNPSRSEIHFFDNTRKGNGDFHIRYPVWLPKNQNKFQVGWDQTKSNNININAYKIALSENLKRYDELLINKQLTYGKSINGEDIYYQPTKYTTLNKQKPDVKPYYNNIPDDYFKLIGEKTPSLMYLKDTHQRLFSVNPHVKIILSLRDPIERAYSAYSMQYGRGLVDKDFLTLANDDVTSKNNIVDFSTQGKHYMRKGLYYQQLKNILEWFNRDNILIVFLEQLKLDPKEVYKQIYDFLGVEYLDVNYNIVPGLDYGIKTKSKPLTDEEYNSFIHYFEQDVQDLEKFLDIDIRERFGWLKPRNSKSASVGGIKKNLKKTKKKSKKLKKKSKKNLKK
jgi:hypothetical protein